MSSTKAAYLPDAASMSDANDFGAALHARMEELIAEAPKLAKSYQSADPFPHIALDNFLPEELIDAVHDSFPGPESDVWTKLPTDDQRGKWAANDQGRFPQAIRTLIAELNSGAFVKFLETLTGIDELIVDAGLAGGGLHRIERGGKLSLHVDFSHHPTNGLNRRLNVLLYLNKEWEESYGGHLELWRWGESKAEREAAARILPKYNRLAIFSTSPISWHGHPEPLASPEGLGRQSIALYYFSNGRPEHEGQEHNTLFRSRPDEGADISTKLVRAASSGLMRDLLPPIIYRGLRRAWNRGGSLNE